MGRSGMDEYKYSTESPQAITGWEEQQSLTVLHEPAKASYVLRTPHGLQEQGSSGFTQSDNARMYHAQNDLYGRTPGGEMSRQGKLFGMGYDPGSSVVDYMAGTREGRSMSLTMLGIAQNQTQQKYGRSLTPSTNLSEHSAQLVGHLREKGIVPPGEGGQIRPPITNDMQFRDYPMTHFTETGERQMSHEEVMAGRRTSRQMIRQAKPPKATPAPEYEQGTLF
jgi:hypothetical protein